MNPRTRMITHQTWWSIFWGAIEFVIVLICFAISNYLTKEILYGVFPTPWISRNSYIVSIPLAILISLFVLGYLIVRSYYKVNGQYVNFRVNQLFYRNRYDGYQQGTGLANPLTQPVDSIPWTTIAISSEETEVMGSIDGDRDLYRVTFKHSLTPNSARILFQGKSEPERILNSKINARAACISAIQTKIKSGNNPINEDMDLDQFGIFVQMTIEKCLSSRETLKSINDVVEARAKRKGIDALTEGEKGLTSDDAAALLAGTLKRETKTIVHRFEGDPELMKKLKMEIEGEAQ